MIISTLLLNSDNNHLLCCSNFGISHFNVGTQASNKSTVSFTLLFPPNSSYTSASLTGATCIHIELIIQPMSANPISELTFT